MPTYPFRCDCENRFEVTQSITDYSGQAECPLCHRVTNHRIYTPFVTPPHMTERETPADASTPASIQPNVTLTNCTIKNAGLAGVKIGKGVRVKSRGLRVQDTPIGVDNEGHFDGPDTRFE